ncbi:MAG TPA: trehalose-6-phosphate synthase [Thermoanaerobaculia bacterium]|jgi:trehalose 6-phosphate synthase|nr:trehalose-6-phosphate synthase [Thermoanaerobaculia bacterium]
MSTASAQTTPETRLHQAGQMPLFRRRVLVVSDRLPIHLTREGGDGWRAARTSGALISALTPVLRERRGVWVGWPGVTEEEAPEPQEVLAGAIQEGGYSLRPVSLSSRDIRGAYEGFGGEILWPLFHEQPLQCRFEPASWQAYRRVNRKFARAVAKTLAMSSLRGESDLLWVHNHLLMNLAAELRALGASCRTAFFLHIPFPAPDLFLKLPWRERLLIGLLSYDQVGFQTGRDLKNFLDCMQALGASVEPQDGLWCVHGETRLGGFHLRAGAFPVGVDYRGLVERAAEPRVEEAAERLRALHPGRRLLLGIDRLDHSKGILEKLDAFAELIGRHADLHERVSLVQFVVPSREELPRNADLRREIERRVGEINGRFSRPGWIPVHYHQRTLDADERLAWCRAADVAFVTPLREGMNLFAKEYCAANLDERGALVLSEFAGASAQLSSGALLVNPYDARATARTLLRALRLQAPERNARMRKLRNEVRRHDIYWWAESFLAAALDEAPAEILEPVLP